MTLTSILHMNWKLNVSQQQSRIFYCGNDEFKIVFHPKLCNDILYIFLYGKDRKSYEVKVHLVDNSENPVFEEHFEGFFTSGRLVWSLDREKLMLHDDVLRNETATFKISISTSEGTPIPYVEKETSVTQVNEVSPCLQTLSQDYSKLFNNAENSDVVLQCGELKINAHRIILSARSDIFADMFGSDMVENKNGPVNTDDIDPAILETFIRYIYSGKVDDLSMETALLLYDAAHRYAIEDLRHRCVLYIVENLSIDWACEALILADIHGDVPLQYTIACFIAKNKEFLLSDMWDTFTEQHPFLAITVYKVFSVSILCRIDDFENA